MEPIISFVFGFFIGLLLTVLGAGLFSSRPSKKSVEDLLKWPWLEIEGTELEGYIERRIEGGHVEAEVMLRKLAGKLGYAWEKDGTWVKVQGRKNETKKAKVR